MTDDSDAVSARTVKELASELQAVIIGIGARCGDDESLVRAKARVAADLFEELDRVPLDLPCRMPTSLKPAKVKAAIRLAALEGYNRAQRRFLWAAAERLPLLCTSMLLKRT